MKYILFLLSILLSSLAVAQEKITYKGVVADKDKTPLDVFSVVIFNIKDSTKQVYANTFSNGDFNVDFGKKKEEDYKVYILSVGYADTYLKLDALRDTITLHKKSMRLDDAVVKGRRDVNTSLGTYGGISYDVSSTYLSDMGTSTKLLNFIPGVSVSDLGEVKLLNSRDEVVIYINNVKMNDTEKLLSLKSEDIKSVEVITNPVARFKGAKAVLYIKTNRAVDGFSSRIGTLYMVGDRMTYGAPSAEMSFTKKKVTVSAAYRYTYHDNFTSNYSNRKIDETVYSGGWQISEETKNTATSNTHWYSTSLNYAINSKNTFVAEYTGSANNDRNEKLSDQAVSVNSQGVIYNNVIDQDNDPKYNKNRVHLNYIGEYSDKFNITADVDFSNRLNKNLYKNNWFINDILTGEQSDTDFYQNEKSNGYAITSEILLNNTIKDKHIITYGLEHSYLRDDVSLTTSDETNNSSQYNLDSNFLKFIAEYAYKINSKLDIRLGFNYMYSNLKDNNSDKKGVNYNNLAPSLSLNYFNSDKELGINYSISYENYQPSAGDRNDVIVTVQSPYEITRGNKDIHNSIGYFSDLSLTYKKFGANLNVMFLTNDLIDGTIVEENNGKPLFVNTSINKKKPITNITLGLSYSNNIAFWTTNIYASATYALFNLEQATDIFEQTSGFIGGIYMNNQFKLPLDFYIYLDGYYRTKGYVYIRRYEPTFNMDLAIEKRFFKNNFSISIKGSGILAEKIQGVSVKEFGIYNNYRTKGYGTRRCFSVSASWRFNNHKKVQQAKDNAYLDML